MQFPKEQDFEQFNPPVDQFKLCDKLHNCPALSNILQFFTSQIEIHNVSKSYKAKYKTGDTHNS